MKDRKKSSDDDKSQFHRKEYERELRLLQVELCKLQDWVKLKGLRGPEEDFFVNPETHEPTGQLYAYEYITTFKGDQSVYTGLNYHKDIFYGPWVYGNKLPKQ